MKNQAYNKMILKCIIFDFKNMLSIKYGSKVINWCLNIEDPYLELTLTRCFLNNEALLLYTIQKPFGIESKNLNLALSCFLNMMKKYFPNELKTVLVRLIIYHETYFDFHGKKKKERFVELINQFNF